MSVVRFMSVVGCRCVQAWSTIAAPSGWFVRLHVHNMHTLVCIYQPNNLPHANTLTRNHRSSKKKKKKNQKQAVKILQKKRLKKTLQGPLRPPIPGAPRKPPPTCVVPRGNGGNGGNGEGGASFFALNVAECDFLWRFPFSPFCLFPRLCSAFDDVKREIAIMKKLAHENIVRIGRATLKRGGGPWLPGDGAAKPSSRHTPQPACFSYILTHSFLSFLCLSPSSFFYFHCSGGPR